MPFPQWYSLVPGPALISSLSLLWSECLSPPYKRLCGNSNAQCDGLRRVGGLWEVLGHEHGALMNGSSVLTKEAPESSKAL